MSSKYTFFMLIAFNAACCGLNACAQKHENPVLDTVFKDIAYSDNIPAQKMDVWLVKNRNANTPLVILLHGGGWIGGDKADLTGFASLFINSGVNVINLNYSLTTLETNSPRYGDMMHDLHQMITYTLAHAREWNIRKSRYVMWGASAGAHLALLYAYEYDKEGLIVATSGFGTPAKLNDSSWNADPFKQVGNVAFARLIGQQWTGDSSNQEMIKASPYFSKKFKPTLLIHGEQDTVVPSAQALLMYKRLQEVGIDSQYITIKNGGHSGEGSSQKEILDVLQKCVDWVKKHSTDM